MTQEPVKPGDLVFSVDDHALGIVSAVSERTLTVLSIDGSKARLWLNDVYTVQHGRVTMIFSNGPLDKRDIAINRYGG